MRTATLSLEEPIWVSSKLLAIEAMTLADGYTTRLWQLMTHMWKSK
jgi:hypothetical protein